MNIVLLGKMAAWCHPELKKRLASPHQITTIRDPRRVEEFSAELSQADVICGWPLTQAILERCQRLKLVQAAGAGIDGMELDKVPDGVQVANTFHHEVAIAEYVVMAMLVLARQPHRHDTRLRHGDWEGSCIWGESPVLRELFDETLLLVGAGHIAREVESRARAFGMRVLMARRNDPWREWLPVADWVVPACPLTHETTGLIGAPEFAIMKPTAHMINTTRGRVVDERAAYEALRDRRIAGAALDVWYQYPADPDEVCLPSRFPFHELDNVLLSPHNSGWTNRTIMGRVEDIADNINRLERGEEVRNRLK